jgi:hypothetical protein
MNQEMNTEVLQEDGAAFVLLLLALKRVKTETGRFEYNKEQEEVLLMAGKIVDTKHQNRQPSLQMYKRIYFFSNTVSSPHIPLLSCTSLIYIPTALYFKFEMIFIKEF